MSKIILALPLLLSWIISASAQNTVSFDNQSGEPALVKLVGPTETQIDVPDGTIKAVQALAGKYFIKIRYGTPGRYYYTRGQDFTVDETTTTTSEITITLHKVVNGNYVSGPISEQEFGVLQESQNDSRHEIIDAMDKGDGETVCKLVKAHPELFDARASDGNTPLHWAAASGHKDIAELLLSKGVTVNVRANNGFVPLHIAAAKGQKALAEFLLAEGADVNAKDDTGMTPLHWAVRYGQTDLVKLLLAKGADVNAKEEKGTTPLHFAARDGLKDVAELLLAKGANINAKDTIGGTPLHTAAWKGKKNVAELLLAKGAEVKAKTNQGLTPLGLAIQFHQHDFANWLHAHGVKE